MEQKKLDNVDVFNELIRRGRVGVQPSITPTPTVPEPTKSDYKRGWLTRYFARKVNDINAPVIETNKIQYQVLSDFHHYLIISMRWKISGPEHTTYREDGTVEVVGVVESNQNLLDIAEEELSGMKMRFVDLKQFWRGY